MIHFSVVGRCFNAGIDLRGFAPNLLNHPLRQIISAWRKVVEILLTNEAGHHLVDTVLADEVMLRAGEHFEVFFDDTDTDVVFFRNVLTDDAAQTSVKFKIRIFCFRNFLLQKRDLFGGQKPRVRFESFDLKIKRNWNLNQIV